MAERAGVGSVRLRVVGCVAVSTGHAHVAWGTVADLATSCAEGTLSAHRAIVSMLVACLVVDSVVSILAQLSIGVCGVAVAVMIGGALGEHTTIRADVPIVARVALRLPCFRLKGSIVALPRSSLATLTEVVDGANVAHDAIGGRWHIRLGVTVVP